MSRRTVPGRHRRGSPTPVIACRDCNQRPPDSCRFQVSRSSRSAHSSRSRSRSTERAGVPSLGGVRENRGAGAAASSPSKRRKVPRAANCGSNSASAKDSTGVTQASVPLKIRAHSSRVCRANVLANTERSAGQLARCRRSGQLRRRRARGRAAARHRRVARWPRPRRSVRPRRDRCRSRGRHRPAGCPPARRTTVPPPARTATAAASRQRRPPWPRRRFDRGRTGPAPAAPPARRSPGTTRRRRNRRSG